MDEDDAIRDVAEARRLLEALHARLFTRRRPLPAPPPFPDPEQAGPDGLCALGGRMTPELVVEAYRRGIFPMPVPSGELGWWSPDPRTVLEPGRLHVPKRLARTIKQGRFEVRVDTRWEEVVAGCGDRDDTWITPEFVAVYGELFRRGVVHTVETWLDGRLVGGLYGVSLGGAFMAESMFHTATDASKVAVVGLLDRLHARGYVLCDIQWETRATSVFQPPKLRRREYLARLKAAVDLPVTFA
jgi:leucyl/phenylalanyl-tRNA---protein transferase